MTVRMASAGIWLSSSRLRTTVIVTAFFCLASFELCAVVWTVTTMNATSGERLTVLSPAIVIVATAAGSMDRCAGAAAMPLQPADPQIDPIAISARQMVRTSHAPSPLDHEAIIFQRHADDRVAAGFDGHRRAQLLVSGTYDDLVIAGRKLHHRRAGLAFRHLDARRVAHDVWKLLDRRNQQRPRQRLAVLRAVIPTAGRFGKLGQLLLYLLPGQREADDVERDVDAGVFELLRGRQRISAAAFLAVCDHDHRAAAERLEIGRRLQH